MTTTTPQRLLRSLTSNGLVLLTHEDCERLGLWVRQCGHCCLVQSIEPIDRSGRPVVAVAGVTTTICEDCSRSTIERDADELVQEIEVATAKLGGRR